MQTHSQASGCFAVMMMSSLPALTETVTSVYTFVIRLPSSTFCSSRLRKERTHFVLFVFNIFVVPYGKIHLTQRLNKADACRFQQLLLERDRERFGIYVNVFKCSNKNKD